MKIKLLALPVLLSLLFGACTKDRVPNPDTLNVPQTVIYQANFDSSLDLPKGWSTSSAGWSVDSAAANSSSGYAGVSGKSNVEVSNPTVGGGTATLESKAISTVGYSNIKIIYGARRSKHYSDNGSTMELAWSTDDGGTWNTISYQENTNDSNWYLINGAARIALPASAANQPHLRFRWTANLNATPSGSYRIDDFQVFASK